MTEKPEGEGWEVYKSRTKDAWSEQVLVTAEVPAVPGVWANFSPNDSQATFVGPAVWPNDPRGTWHDHGTLPPGQAGPDGVYANGNPDKGGNWFYRSQGTPKVPAVYDTVEHEAETHVKYVRTARGSHRVLLGGLRAHQLVGRFRHERPEQPVGADRG